jgi:hypothetical protein
MFIFLWRCMPVTHPRHVVGTRPSLTFHESLTRNFSKVIEWSMNNSKHLSLYHTYTFHILRFISSLNVVYYICHTITHGPIFRFYVCISTTYIIIECERAEFVSSPRHPDLTHALRWFIKSLATCMSLPTVSIIFVTLPILINSH